MRHERRSVSLRTCLPANERLENQVHKSKTGKRIDRAMVKDSLWCEETLERLSKS